MCQFEWDNVMSKITSLLLPLPHAFHTCIYVKFHVQFSRESWDIVPNYRYGEGLALVCIGTSTWHFA